MYLRDKRIFFLCRLYLHHMLGMGSNNRLSCSSSHDWGRIAGETNNTLCNGNWHILSLHTVHYFQSL